MATGYWSWNGGEIVKVATQNEVGADFAEYVKATKKGPVVVTSKGKPVAVLLRSDSEEDVERLLMGHSRAAINLGSSSQAIPKGRAQLTSYFGRKSKRRMTPRAPNEPHRKKRPKQR